MTTPDAGHQQSPTLSTDTEGSNQPGGRPPLRDDPRFVLAVLVLSAVLLVAACLYVPGHWEELASHRSTIRTRRGHVFDGEAFPIAILAFPAILMIINGVRYVQLRRRSSAARASSAGTEVEMQAQTPASVSAEHEHRPAASREPGAGECRYCGSTPAVEVTQQAISSIAIYYRVTSWKGWMCRSCAEAVHAEAVTRTMTWAWWGVGVFAIWLFPLINNAGIRRARKLDQPRPTPGVIAPLAEPMPPAQPWARRRAVIATCVGVTLWCVALAFLVITATGGMS